jgi:hypothetical protein
VPFRKVLGIAKVRQIRPFGVNPNHEVEWTAERLQPTLTRSQGTGYKL